jgi:glycosyltransferase involved in cell wall biosynthesis
MTKVVIPEISIICVVLNNVNGIKKTLESIITQLTEDVELIVIDGASTDGTLDILNSLSDNFKYWVSESDGGIYDAWNKGLAASSGRFVAFVGSDDILEHDYVAQCLFYLKFNAELDYISFKIRLANNSKRIIGRKWLWSTFRRQMTVAHVGSLHNRDLYTRHGNYNINFKIAGDYDFLLRPGSRLKAGFIDFIGVTMGVSGVSNRLILRSLIETRRAKITNNACSALAATFDFFLAASKYIIRRLIRI